MKKLKYIIETINFISNNIPFGSINISIDEDTNKIDTIKYDDNIVYIQERGWLNNAYHTIYFENDTKASQPLLDLLSSVTTATLAEGDYEFIPTTLSVPSSLDNNLVRKFNFESYLGDEKFTGLGLRKQKDNSIDLYYYLNDNVVRKFNTKDLEWLDYYFKFYIPTNLICDPIFKSWITNANNSKVVVIPIVDGLTYTLLSDNTFQVTSYTGTATSISLPHIAKQDGKRAVVTSVGPQVFKNKSSLQLVLVPDNIVNFGYEVFMGCTKLQSINFAHNGNLNKFSDRVFSGCTSLTSIEIPDSVEKIGQDFFSGCTALTNVKLPNNLKEVRLGLFEGCTALRNLTIPDSVESIGLVAFRNCTKLNNIIIPLNVLNIGWCAFDFCSSLSNIFCEIASKPAGWDAAWNMKNSNTNSYHITIWGPGFHDASGIRLSTWNNLVSSYGINCEKDYTNSTYDTDSSCPSYIIRKNLTSTRVIFTPKGISRIGAYAFHGCRNITDVVLSEGITSIGDSAFKGCWALKNVIIPNSVIYIYADAFNLCSALTSIFIPASVTDIDASSVFSGCISLAMILVDVNNPKYKSIDGNLYSSDGKTLLKYAIGKTDTTFSIPTDVTTIEKNACVSANTLTEIIIPSTVKTIKNSAFSSCEKLESIVIPKSVTTVGSYAFMGCDSLGTIYCEAEGPEGWNDTWNYKSISSSDGTYNVVWSYTG